MKRYNKLLTLCLIIGLSSQTLQAVYAHSNTRKITSHRIRKMKKRVVPYHLLRKKVNNNDHASYITSSDNSIVQNGIASWYGGRKQRHLTSSGARFNSQNLTAAHPTLPLGSKVLVQSNDTGHSVIVTINDRGPFVKHRIIDLSKAAAAKIGMLNKGIAHVTIKPLTDTEVAEIPE